VADGIETPTAEVIRELTTLGIGAETPEGGNTPYVIVPRGCEVRTLEALIYNDRSARPNRIKQAIEVWDAESFIAYFLAFRDASSRVFADVQAATVTAILDYHEFRESVEGQEVNAPRWGSHKVTLALKKSPEWLLWIASNKKTMDQDAFATFIEDNNPDILEPNAGTMREIASDLHETHEMTYAGTTKAPNGSQRLNYTQENKSTFGKSDASVPESFRVGIPVYVGGGLVSLVARLRWRVAGGKASFWYDLLRADAAERAAFDATRATVTDAIGVPVISGKIG
jgi:uncharacterized protein YfdQ (DUF2303 family)